MADQERDEEIVQAVRKVALACTDEILHILEYGKPADKLRIATTVFGRLVGQLGQEKPQTNDELQKAMAELMEEVRRTA